MAYNIIWYHVICIYIHIYIYICIYRMLHHHITMTYNMVSNHQHIYNLFSNLFRLTTKKSWNLCVTGPMCGDCTGGKGLVKGKPIPWYDVFVNVQSGDVKNQLHYIYVSMNIKTNCLVCGFISCNAFYRKVMGFVTMDKIALVYTMFVNSYWNFIS